MNRIVAHLQKYYGVYLLIVAVVFLILWLPNRATNRYAITGAGRGGCAYILDTKTGQMWLSLVEGNKHVVIKLGRTTNKPIFATTFATFVKQIDIEDDPNN